MWTQIGILGQLNTNKSVDRMSATKTKGTMRSAKKLTRSPRSSFLRLFHCAKCGTNIWQTSIERSAAPALTGIVDGANVHELGRRKKVKRRQNLYLYTFKQQEAAPGK